jgi:hypothetical protein
MYINGKMIPGETIPGMVGSGIKENDGGGEFKCYIVRTFINVTMYPHPAQFKKRKKENKLIVF